MPGSIRPTLSPRAQESRLSRAASSAHGAAQPKEDRLDQHVRRAVANIDKFRDQNRLLPRPRLSPETVKALFNATNDMFTIVLNRFAAACQAQGVQEFNMSMAKEVFPLSRSHADIVDDMVFSGGKYPAGGRLRYRIHQNNPLNMAFNPGRSESENRVAQLAAAGVQQWRNQGSQIRRGGPRKMPSRFINRQGSQQLQTSADNGPMMQQQQQLPGQPQQEYSPRPVFGPQSQYNPQQAGAYGTPAPMVFGQQPQPNYSQAPPTYRPSLTQQTQPAYSQAPPTYRPSLTQQTQQAYSQAPIYRQPSQTQPPTYRQPSQSQQPPRRPTTFSFPQQQSGNQGNNPYSDYPEYQ